LSIYFSSSWLKSLVIILECSSSLVNKGHSRTNESEKTKFLNLDGVVKIAFYYDATVLAVCISVC
jgi:hypothetical protein